ncbi:MAG: four helix bundle protein [Terriglobia bacterium]
MGTAKREPDGTKNPRRIRTFEDLEAWKACAAVRREISTLAKSLPQEERYLLRAQLLRASRSATANIAEGYGRYHYQENIQFLRQSRGSLYELIDHLSVAGENGQIGDGQLQALRAGVLRAIQLVNGYIRYLEKSRKATR